MFLTGEFARRPRRAGLGAMMGCALAAWAMLGGLDGRVHAAESMQVITLRAADGVEIPAVLRIPPGGLNARAPAVVFDHDGPIGHPTDAGDAARWLAEAFARAGYTTLSPLSRHFSGRGSPGYPRATFMSATADIRAAVDWLAQIDGTAGIVLVGQGLGATRVAAYAAQSGDRRVKAMIHLDPMPDLPAWMKSRLGPAGYDAVAARARALVDAGTPGAYVYEPLNPPAGADAVGLLQSAAAWLDWWGPDSTARLTAFAGRIAVPQHTMTGPADPSRTGDIARQALAWLAAQDLAPTPDIDISVVDSASRDGRVMSGLMYEPATGRDPAEPAVIMLYGSGGDTLWSSSHWFSARLAEHGHTVIAARTRAAGPLIRSTTIESEMHDLAGWVETAAAMGFRTLLMAGHSLGGIRATYYVVSTGDARIKGIVYLSPTVDYPAMAKASLGAEKYRAMVADAERLVAAGEGARRIVTGAGPLPPPAVPGTIREFDYTAEAFLSRFGPGAVTTHTEQVARLSIPILAMAGSRDNLAGLDYLRRFTAAAGGPAEMRWYDDGAPHSFEGWEDRVVADTLAWIAARFP
ncbi:MAG: hypothetical protein SFV21_02575 [Rhodospirillaceae bacterium]|nr:hypothetical protein [Rhodospirillaceae bacterium]